MNFTKHSAITMVILTISFIYLWNATFHETEELRVFGSSLVPICVGILSMSLTLRALSQKEGKSRWTWLFFTIGLGLHVLGNVIWLLGAIGFNQLRATDSAYLSWLAAYFLFLLALIYRIWLIRPTLANNSYVFNTIIFLITFATIFIHYFVTPYWEATDDLFQLVVYGVMFPLVDISIVCVITFLHYLHRNQKDKTVIWLFMLAFYLQIAADTLTAVMKTNDQYYQLMLEPMWVTSLLLIGFAALKDQKHTLVGNEEDGLFHSKESSFPYISTLVLVFLEITNHWHLNVLSVGTGIIYFIIITRLLVIMRRNRKLMLEYRELAYHDSLTGLLNRSSFKIDLERKLRAAEKSNQTVTILLIDLDRFKMVNDTLGHLVGDELLKLAARKLQGALEGYDANIYRLGGDEFVVLLGDETKTTCVNIALRVIERLNEPFSITGHEVYITPSIGISAYPYNGVKYDELFKAADAAMYVAKANGKNTFQFYNSKLNETLNRRMKIENELRKAIAQDELHLVYQPKFQLKTRQVYGMEALLRWTHQELGSVSPAEFVPIAEESGLIVEIGEWVLKEACRQTKAWQQRNNLPLCVSVNVSVQQFKQSNLVHTVHRILQETELDASFLELEITESIMQNVDESRRILANLRVLGVKVSLDDFGTGYSSLYVLKKIPITSLKVDKAFIDDLRIGDDLSMVKGIIDIASTLQLDVVAEGIEHEHQVEMLIKYNCGYGQGYYFSKPLSVQDFENIYLS